MTDLPAPPPGGETEPITRKPERRSSLLPVIFLIGLLAAGAYFLTWFLTADPVVKAAVTTRPTPTKAPVNVDPCAHETFDANGCAVVVIERTVAGTGIPPYILMQEWCATRLATPKARRAEVEMVVDVGYTRREAKALVGELASYCSQVVTNGRERG